jgi:hypothetical protein
MDSDEILDLRQRDQEAHRQRHWKGDWPGRGCQAKLPSYDLRKLAAKCGIELTPAECRAIEILEARERFAP